jgi:hypothetical protein
LGWSIFIVFERSNVCVFFFSEIVFLLFFIDNFGIEGKENLMVLLMESIDWKYTTEYSSSTSFQFCFVLFCFITQYAKKWIFDFSAEFENKTFISQMKLFNLAFDVMNETCWFWLAPLVDILLWKFTMFWDF